MYLLQYRHPAISFERLHATVVDLEVPAPTPELILSKEDIRKYPRLEIKLKNQKIGLLVDLVL